MNRDKLAHEKKLFLYTSALDRGDVDTLIDILKDARFDAELARMINEINDVYATEDQPISAEKFRFIKEQTAMITVKPMKTVWVRPQPRYSSPATLIAAMIAFVLFTGVLLSFLNHQQPNVLGATQVTPTVTPLSSTTPKFTLTTYQGVIVGKRFPPDLSGGPFEEHVWFEAPNHHRVESYYGGSGFNGYFYDPEAQLATPTSPDFRFNFVDVNDGHFHWYFSGVLLQAEKVQETLDYLFYSGEDTSLDALLKRVSTDFTDVKASGNETFLDRSAYVIDAKPKKQNQGSLVDHVVMRFDQQTNLELSYQEYDSKGNIGVEWAFNSLIINQPIDPNIFKIKLSYLNSDLYPPSNPDFAATNFNDQWYQLSEQTPFVIFRPGLATIQKQNWEFGLLNHDSFANIIEQDFQNGKDLYGPTPAIVWEGLPSAIRAKVTIPVDATPVKVGQFDGYYWEKDQYHWLSFDAYNSEFVLRTLSLSQADMISWASSFSYLAPSFPDDKLRESWTAIARSTGYPVFKAASANTSIVVSNARLDAQLPALENQLVKQVYMSADKPEVELILTQGLASQMALEFGKSNLTGEIIPINGQIGFYRQDTDLQWLIISTDKTLVVLQARPDAVSKDTLLAIATSLKVVPPACTTTC